MNRQLYDFPDRPRLWRGALLATIAHAISVAEDPQLSYELSWDGINYSRQDSQGTRGTVTFAPAATVAVFRDDSSDRTPWRSANQYELNWFLRGIPEDLERLARDEALQYVLDEYDGKVSPVITAAFWGYADSLTAAEPWTDVVRHGAHLLSTELLEPEDAIAEWTDYYDLSDEQSTLLRGLHNCRVKNDKFTLSESEYKVLTSRGVNGVEESRDLLAAIGIKLPE